MICRLASYFSLPPVVRRQIAALLVGLVCSTSTFAQSVVFEYDGAGRLKKAIYSDGSTVTYALDAAGNRTSVVSTGPDVVAPGAPSNLASSALSATSVRLTWTAATDNAGGSGIASYRVERCAGGGCSSFAEISSAIGTATTVDDTAAVASTTYRYRIRARDGASNNSAYSNITSVTTPAVPDTTPPTVPGSLAASALSSTSIRLTWTASTDSGGSNLASYRIERCTGAACSSFLEISSAPSGATSFDDTTAVASTTYRYRIRARDGSANDSGYSNIPSVSTPATPDTTPPTAPGSLGGSAPTSTQVILTWTASTDTGGSNLASYRVERCTGSACSSFVEIGSSATPGYTDTTTVGTTAYRYQVRARDGASNNSPYSNIYGVTTPDSIAPTVPVIQVVTGVSSTRADVTWAASTDSGGSGLALYRIERCAGASCSNFSEIGTIAAPATTYNDLTTAGSTNYTYRMRAQDGAGLQSGYSNVGSTITPDTLPPTTPGNLTATPASATQINLAWNASTDQGGGTLASYRIERCIGASCSDFALVTHTLNLSYNDTSVSGSTVYRYQVRAIDVQSNASTWSNIASATTPAAPDTTPPAPPPNTSGSSPNSNTVNINWTAATDTGGSGFAGYRVWRCVGSNCSGGYTLLASVGTSTTSYSDTTVSGSTWYHYYVTAFDNAGNTSAHGTVADIQTGDTLAPSAPGALTASGLTSTTVELNWAASTDTGGSGLSGYRIERCSGAGCSNFTLLTSTSATSYLDTSVSGSVAYNYRVNAIDGAGNQSGYSNTAPATTPDTIAPSAPSGLGASAPNSTTVNLGWTGSSDTGGSGLSGYRIERCTGAGCSSFTLLTTTSATSYSDTSVAGSVVYNYRVNAIDGAGNQSGYSNTAPATTPDTIAPSAPSGLGASAPNSTTVNLGWTGSSDTGGSGLSGYRIERCTGAGCSSFALLTTTSATSYSDTSVSGSVVYNYRVNAVDGAGNQSGYSNTAPAATPDTIAPTPPTIQSVTGVSSTRVDIGWAAGADSGGSGLALYRIERCAGSGCSSYAELTTVGSGTTSYSDNTTAGSTTYNYRMRSQDGAGLLSGYSNVGGDTTPDTLGPTTPGGFGATATSTTSISLSWNASTDQGGGTIASYRIERCNGAGCSNFALVTHTANLSYTDTSVIGNVTYRYRVLALDVQSNPSGWSDIATATTPFAPDNTPPSSSNVTGSAASSSVINLTWTVSTDSGSGLAGYRLWRCIEPNCASGYTLRGTFAAGVNSFQDTGLAGFTWHRYYVTPFDVAGNQSPSGGVANVRTL